MSSGERYSYDINGIQIQRVVGGDTYTLSYYSKNRLVEVKKNGVTQAKFTYAGDGNRVKGEITGGATTTYIGNYLEWTTDGIGKYYYAGSTRVAMRTESSTINCVLGNHLGSTSITTDNQAGLLCQR